MARIFNARSLTSDTRSQPPLFGDGEERITRRQIRKTLRELSLQRGGICCYLLYRYHFFQIFMAGASVSERAGQMEYIGQL